MWEQPETNRLRAAAMAGDADLIVLPEMFTTGFTMSTGAAERDGRLTLEWMVALAREHNAAVAGSVAVEEGGRLFNRLYFVKPDGIWAHYDKRHLFSHADEHKVYSPGSERVVVEWRGVRILLQICYDLRFPAFSRNRGDYDMILYVASWPESRIGAWDALLRARAIENVCYVAGVNRVGDDPAAHYVGHSALIDFRGNTLSTGEGETAIEGWTDIPQLAAFRAKFPALQDADYFTLQ
jgi:predicted amidohydrolase